MKRFLFVALMLLATTSNATERFGLKEKYVPYEPIVAKIPFSTERFYWNWEVTGNAIVERYFDTCYIWAHPGEHEFVISEGLIKEDGNFDYTTHRIPFIVGKPIPIPEGEAVAGIIVEDVRPLRLGRAISDPKLAPYIGENGILSILNVKVVDEFDNTPEQLKEILNNEGELPVLILLDKKNRIVKTVPIPTEVTVNDLISSLPKVEGSGVARSPLKAVNELSTIDTLPIPEVSNTRLSKYGAAGEKDTLYPFGLGEQPPLMAMDAAFDILPREKWKETNHRHMVWHVFDQLDGMCTSNASTMQVMLQRILQGQPKVVGSPENLYGQHSNWGTGSTLWENRAALFETGVADRDTVPKSSWRRRDWPTDWEKNANRMRIQDSMYFSGSSKEIFEKVATAIQHGYFVNIGIIWPRGGGHSIVALDLVKYKGKWALIILNSWGPEWGDYGMAIITQEQCDSLSRFGAFTVQCVTLPQNETHCVLAPIVETVSTTETPLSIAP